MHKIEADFGLSNMELISVGKTDEEREKIDRDTDAGVACHYAISLLGLINSKEAIQILEQIKENNTEWYYTCKSNKAKRALENIKEKGVKK